MKLAGMIMKRVAGAGLLVGFSAGAVFAQYNFPVGVPTGSKPETAKLASKAMVNSGAQSQGRVNDPTNSVSGTPGGTDGKKGGDPICLESGNNRLDGTDLVIPCPLLPLELRRSYNSVLLTAEPLGYGWHHGYDWQAGLVTNELQGSLRTVVTGCT